MNSPCEILVDGGDEALAARLLEAARAEVDRIETKYSRYRAGSVVEEINRAAGSAVEVDSETGNLLDYAAHCFALSEGLFDVTTGVLRKLWTFNSAEAAAPSPAEVQRVLSFIGWDKVRWERPRITLPRGGQLDLGGICKEYAADRVLALMRQETSLSLLVNLGGDIAAAGDRAWSVGIESVKPGAAVAQTIALRAGGIATSGHTKRYCRVGGKKLGHILNPKTGWPVEGAPLSVTVGGATCTEAGFWSTLGMLHGQDAESFLQAQGIHYWCARD